MKREIKFRAWGVASKVMFLPETDEGWEFNHGCISQPFNTILMQFTGLKDKNGVEIYEGDIVKGNNQVGTIEWFEIDTCFAVQTYKRELWTIGKYRERMGSIEVIGNIYENPELL